MDTFPASLPYSTFCVKNPEYNSEFWQKCRALYAGGQELLGNHHLLKKLMPTHTGEAEEIYHERLRRAFYIPYAGAIVDKLVAELTARPLSFELREAGESEDFIDGDAHPNELPPFYANLVDNCSPQGSDRCSLNHLARKQILTALQCGQAWALVDLPAVDSSEFHNRAAQDAAGALSAYICPVEPEAVVDWEEADDGELLWVLIETVSQKRASLLGNRGTSTLRWQYYTKDSWAVYEIEKDISETLDEEAQVRLVSSGSHSFDRVPVIRMKLSSGLWAMAKLESLAQAHLNQRNALSWAQLKSLFPVAVLYAAKPDPHDPNSENLGRVNQPAAQGYLRVFAENDKLEYLAPDGSGYAAAQKDLSVLRDEMHRILYSMALSVDNTGAAMGRSAESKAIDQAATSVILKALGAEVREHLENLLDTAAAGRRETYSFIAVGMDIFSDVSLADLLKEAESINKLGIESPTFQKLYRFKLIKQALGRDVRDSDLEVILGELSGAAPVSHTTGAAPVPSTTENSGTGPATGV